VSRTSGVVRSLRDVRSVDRWASNTGQVRTRVGKKLTMELDSAGKPVKK
jgi:hypothetical protein